MVKRKVTSFLIHLRKMNRNSNARYGRFVRPDKPPHPDAADLHLWQGRELTLEEFNQQFDVAVRSVLTTDTVFGKAIVREVLEPAGEADSALLESLRRQHADEIAAIQEGVNEFTADANVKLREASAQIEAQQLRIQDLERQLAEAAKAAESTAPETSEAPVESELSNPDMSNQDAEEQPPAVVESEPAVAEPPKKKKAKK